MHAIEALNYYADEKIENEHVTDDHVDDEVAENARVGVPLWLQVKASAIHCFVHSGYPALIRHKYH